MTEKLITAKEYARRHSVRPDTVCGWARSGRIPGIRTNAGWMLDPDQEPPRKIAKRGGEVGPSGRIKCCTCKRWRTVAMFSPSGRLKGRCADCASYMSRKKREPTHPSVVSYALDMKVYLELEYAPQEIKDLRKQRVEHHAKRIEALGLAGDGVKWRDL